MKNFLISIIGMVLSLILFSCAPMVKTDLKSLNENPEKYKGKWVIVTTDLKSVVDNPKAYRGKNIELTGYVKLDNFGFTGINDWSFMLKDVEGNSLRCYEWEYRVYGWIMPEMALRQAEKENGPVTVQGKLEGDFKIELRWIEYKGQHYNTDYKPPGIWLPFF
jgi:hypothetical protein